jgi:hypothetical protein
LSAAPAVYSSSKIVCADIASTFGDKRADRPDLVRPKIELAINLKTAKALGIAMPPRCSPAPTR